MVVWLLVNSVVAFVIISLGLWWPSVLTMVNCCFVILLMVRLDCWFGCSLL